MNEENSEIYDALVVGAGPAGTEVAMNLEQDGEDYTVADPEGEYLGAFADQVESIGMDEMRSPHEHSIGDSLWLYALEEDRLDEIGAGRPSWDLFYDHAMDSVSARGLGENLEPERVEEIELEEDGFYRAVVGDEAVRAENIVLANGKGPLNYPSYAEELPENAEDYHVFESDFDVYDAADYDGPVYVVGGGITAVQSAVEMSEQGADVRILSRSDLEVADQEADEESTDLGYVRDALEGMSEEERLERVEDERYDGTVPEYMLQELEESDVEVLEGVDLEGVEYDDGIDIELTNGESAEDVKLVYATGFEEVYQDSFYREIAEELGLGTAGDRDIPVLDDQTLEWQYEDGAGSNIYVAGELAQTVLGPYAGNIRGAEMAAETIADDIADTPQLEQSTAEVPGDSFSGNRSETSV